MRRSKPLGGRPADPQYRVQLRRPDRARRRGPPAHRGGRPARGHRRGGHQCGALYGRPARSRSGHPDRWRTAPVQLPHLAVRVRGVLLLRGPVARLRAGGVRRRAPRVRPATAPVRTVGQGRSASSARSARPSSSRSSSSSSSSAARSRSSLAAAIALVTVLAAREVFGLPGVSRLPDAAAARDRPGAHRHPRCGVPGGARGQRAAAHRGRDRARAVAAFTRPDPRDGLATWMATVFGALYVSLLAFVVRLGLSAPDVRRRRR